MKKNLKKIIITLIISIGAALGFIKYNSAGEAVIVQDREVAEELSRQEAEIEKELSSEQVAEDVK